MPIKCPKCQTDNPDTVKFCGECGTQLPSPEDIAVTETLETPIKELTRGTTFANRYEIIEELGKGGMGRVYRVEDTKLKQEIALKLIKPEIAKDKKTIERFRNELKIARNIRHKNVCGMFDLGETEGTHFITMEYIRGEDLKSFIHRSGQLAIGTAVRVAKQVCEGLSEAHRLGVVHRDLKPQNVMIDKEGNSRIMDFGIARSIEAKGITGAGVMIGTPEYMSPEQVEAKDIDLRSDIYSLGVILYEMVTGRVPFEADTPFAIGVKHKSEAPKDPVELNSQIPEDLSKVILRCLEKDKAKRYQNADELHAELSNIEKGMPTTEKIVPERKPITSREITVTFGLKKLFVPAFIFIAAVIIGIVIWQLLSQKAPIPIPSDKPSLAIMYFENNTGDESLDHWRKALSELLIADLSQSKYIRVLSGEALFNILSQLNQLEAKSYSSEVLKQVAVRGRVGHIMVGDYAKAGDIFRLNVMLQEAETGEMIASEGVEGRGEENLFSMVDELTRRIKANFSLSAEEVASDIDKEVGQITTSSPDAYKYYSDGRKHQLKGDFRKAVRFYEMATDIDPEFAMAWRAMAMTYHSLRFPSLKNKCLKRALDLSDRISDRERYQIQGNFYYHTSEKTWDKAIDAYNKLLQLYPDDWSVLVSLGIVYSSLEEFDKTIELNEVSIQNKNEAFHPYVNQAWAYMRKGMYDKSQAVLEYYLNNVADNAVIRWYLACNHLNQGKYDHALAEVDKSLLLDPDLFRNFWIKGDIYLCKGDSVRAEKEYLKLLESGEKSAHLFGRERLVYLYLFQGRFEKLKEMAKQGIELSERLGELGWKSSFHSDLAYILLKSESPQRALEECGKALSSAVEAEDFGAQRWALYGKGRTYLEMKSLDEAQRTAEELEELIEKGMNKKAIRYYHHLKGLIELELNNHSHAIDYLKKAISALPFQASTGIDIHALFMEPLAFAYYRTGNLGKAQEEFEKITQLTTGRFLYGDIYVKGFYMLGKISEQQGNTAKAIEHYEKFLDLWKDADPGIAEVEDAKKRLTGLQSQ